MLCQEIEKLPPKFIEKYDRQDLIHSLSFISNVYKQQLLRRVKCLEKISN